MNEEKWKSRLLKKLRPKVKELHERKVFTFEYFYILRAGFRKSDKKLWKDSYVAIK